MAAEDIHVRLCLQELVRLDLEVKAIIQVNAMHPNITNNHFNIMCHLRIIES